MKLLNLKLLNLLLKLLNLLFNLLITMLKLLILNLLLKLLVVEALKSKLVESVVKADDHHIEVICC